MTTLGHHTVPELHWLVKSRDYFYGRTSGAIAAFYGTWQAKDKTALDAWYKDWQAFEMRYALARQDAMAFLDYAETALWNVPDGVINADEQWAAILTAFQPVANTRSPGDFSDLVTRLRAAGCEVTFPEIPPDDSVDWDLAAYKTADDALQHVKDAANKLATPGLSIGAGIAIGLVAAVVLAKVTR